MDERAARKLEMQPEAVTMIPTWYRANLPKTLSYPLGAKVISEALEGVPQTGSLVVEFYFWNKKRRSLSGVPQPYRVLSVSYWHDGFSPLHRKVLVSGRSDPGWIITVEPAPRSLRHAIQSKLLTEALPRIKRWLVASQGAGGRTGGHNIVFRFDELANELRVEENSTIEWSTVRAD